MLRKQATAKSRAFRSVSTPLARRNANMACGATHASHSAGLIFGSSAMLDKAMKQVRDQA
jgi:hypothetical protein